LGKAVNLARLLYEQDKLHKVPIGTAHERWAYKSLSSAGNQAVAAVKSFGLITVEGEGDKRMLAVTETGRKIILEAPDRDELLKKAALGPPLFASLWEKYKTDGLPSDGTLRHHLIFDRNFNEDSVDDVIDRFKSTISYAKLTPGETLDDNSTLDNEECDEPDEKDRNPAPPKPHQEKSPRKVLAGISEDVLTLQQGAVVLQLPDQLTAENMEDIEDWLKIVLRKVKRNLDKQPDPSEG
jgi:hypothetical protein